MMRKIAFLAVAMVCLSLPAQAVERACCRPVPNWYAGISGSVAFLKDVELDETPPQAGTSDKLSFDTGYNVSAQLGYRVFPNIRVEGEVGYRVNDLAEVDGVAFTPAPNFTSEHKSLALMGNVYYDWHNSSAITPYVGAGAGMVHIVTPITVIYIPTGESHRLREWTMAYQFMTGISYAIPDSPFEVNFGYRYFTGQDGEVSFTTVPGGYKVKFNNDSHNIEVGIRLFF